MVRPSDPLERFSGDPAGGPELDFHNVLNLAKKQPARLTLLSRLLSNGNYVTRQMRHGPKISFEMVARSEGFEPPTLGSEDRCSIH